MLTRVNTFFKFSLFFLRYLAAVKRKEKKFFAKKAKKSYRRKKQGK